MDSFECAFAFFNTDRFRCLVQLKCLHLYREALTCFYTEQPDGIGVLLSYPTSAVAWDRANYAQTQAVLLPVASSISAAQSVLRRVQDVFDLSEPLVFKFCDSATRDVFSDALTLSHTKTFVSYTSYPDQRFEAVPLVTVTPSLERTCYPLYMENGYTSAELDQAAEDGAFSVVRYADGNPVSACFVFRNFDNIWEIAGVRTLADKQRQGLAQAVVQTALRAIQAHGYLPRYQAELTNLPSIALAEKLRLYQCLRFEHYLLTQHIAARSQAR